MTEQVNKSGKGNCYDNSVTESFFKTLKTELVYDEYYRTQEDARHCLFEYIEVFYNRKRKHSTLGYQSPVEFLRYKQQSQATAFFIVASSIFWFGSSGSCETPLLMLCKVESCCSSLRRQYWLFEA